ncbi:phosphate/phosphite/phosphonate ABC transporter substrate-binding protein [Sphingomonas sp. PAMC 26617]|uniref:phosphate/phosphite/phosphonate ABC transporter substrate-binding protein n=1 Tax=Sphingomonas sp. PAMC 26617 TaxID=1112216 RepID=UPI000288964C|nr:PhnD/SsuA/transferrin family substrate-binding protein [Sphingomonas sp. PAMC 26617]
MNRGIASLGMYDHPAQHAANDRLWGEIARRLDARGIRAPERLDRSRSVEAIWRAPDLLFAQTCGYPLVSDPDLALRVIGVPVYDVPGCAGGEHVSHIVFRSDDPAATLDAFRDRRAAINARSSNSGHNLFRATVAPLARDGRFFAAVIETGSHRASVDAVRRGRADIAAIDAVTFAALRRFEPAAIAGLRILANTAASPTLPFVTARSTSTATVAALRIALAEAVADPSLADVRAALFLADVIPAGEDRYARVGVLEDEAVAAGYPVLR